MQLSSKGYREIFEHVQNLRERSKNNLGNRGEFGKSSREHGNTDPLTKGVINYSLTCVYTKNFPRFVSNTGGKAILIRIIMFYQILCIYGSFKYIFS